MLEDYKNALKSGQRAYRACVARGQSPYLAVLDDILVNVNIVAQRMNSSSIFTLTLAPVIFPSCILASMKSSASG